MATGLAKGIRAATMAAYTGGRMSTPLRQLLEEFRASSKTEREKGTYFERLGDLS